MRSRRLLVYVVTFRLAAGILAILIAVALLGGASLVLVADRLRRHDDVEAVELDPFLETGRNEEPPEATGAAPWHGEAVAAAALAIC